MKPADFPAVVEELGNLGRPLKEDMDIRVIAELELQIKGRNR
jgi:hypothetical protein